MRCRCLQKPAPAVMVFHVVIHYAVHQFFSLSPFLHYLPVNSSYVSKDLGVDCELTVRKVSCTNNSSGKIESFHDFNVFQYYCCLAFLSLGQWNVFMLFCSSSVLDLRVTTVINLANFHLTHEKNSTYVFHSSLFWSEFWGTLPYQLAKLNELSLALPRVKLSLVGRYMAPSALLFSAIPLQGDFSISITSSYAWYWWYAMFT